MANYGTVTGYQPLNNGGDFQQAFRAASDAVQFIQGQVSELGKLQKNQKHMNGNVVLEKADDIVKRCYVKGGEASAALTQSQELAQRIGDNGYQLRVKSTARALQKALDDVKKKVNEIRDEVESRPMSDTTSTDGVEVKDHAIEYDRSNRGSRNPFDNQQQQLLSEDHASEALERNKAIKNIETEMLGLHELMKDIQMLVVEQGEVIDRIEDAIDTTGNRVVNANKQLLAATRYKKCSRKLSICIAIIIATVILVILLAIIIGVCGPADLCKKQ